MKELNFPNALHQQATETITTFFLAQPNIDTILLTNSLARGKATPESDIDMAVLVISETTSAIIATLENNWQALLYADPILNQYRNSGNLLTFTWISLMVILNR